MKGVWFSLLGVFLFVSCTRFHGPRNVFRYPIESEPPTLDTTAIHDHVSFEVLYNLVEGLTREDENLKVVPGLAERWEISKDGKTYTFFLRDAKWSDGVSIRAQDFEFAWRRLLDPKRAAEYAYFLFDVENAEAYNSGKITDVKQVGFHALNDKTFEVRLHHKASYFLHIPTFQLTAPLRQEIVEAHPTEFTEPKYFRATGPYRLREWAHDSKVVIETNPYYWPYATEGKPQIDRVEFYVVKEDSTALNMYERGELDVALRIPSLDLDRVKKMKDYHSTPVLRGYYYGFNVEMKPFDNVLVRRAFAHAVNREELVMALKGGQIPTTSWVPRGMFGYEDKVGLSYNPEKAKDLLKQAGYPGGKNFPKITLMYDSLEMNKMVAERLQYAWKTVLNIPEIEIQTQEWKVYLDTLTHNTPQLWRMGWGADFPDPHNFLDLFMSNSGNNNTHWKSPKYDSIVMKAAESFDVNERVKLYRQAQKMLLEDDAVIIPLFQTATEMVLKPYIENFKIDPLENPQILHARIRESAPAAVAR